MVRFINTMVKIMALLAFLPFAMTGQDYACKTDSMEDYSPNPQYDRTESQINEITELLQLFDKQTIKNTFNKWISQNRKFVIPSKIINSKNITFTKFISDEDIVPISNLIHIFGHFNSDLYIVESDEKSCENINEEQRRPQSILDDISNAMDYAMIDRIKLIKRSVFQSISNKWMHPDKNSYAPRENYYSRFKSHGYIGTLPWLFDNNEVIINGLKKFDHLSITYLPIGRTYYHLQLKDVKIRWNIASVKTMQLNFDIRKFVMRGSINELRLQEDLNIELGDIVKVSNGDYTTETDEELAKILQELIANGIQQTTQKIRYDGTKEFINVIGEILQPFDDELFEKTLLNLKKPDGKIFSLGTISTFKLDIEAFHLENITCIHSDDLEVYGRLKYEKIKGQVDILLSIAHNKVHSVPISVDLFIKETNIGISLKHSNSSNNVAVKIHVNWTDADTTITIISSLYHLSRQERIVTGNQVFQLFIRTIENQIIDVTKSTFRPIFGIYKNLSNSFTLNAAPSNNFNNQRRYFALIHDYWEPTPHFTLPVEIAIEGSWNFNPINVHYIKGKLFIKGLKLENVTASIKQVNNLKNSVITKYTMSDFSLKINHMENEVFVTVPSSDQNPANIIKKLESTVGKFIEYLIYGNSTKYPNYHAKLGKSVNETMKKALFEDRTSAYDASSQFATNFVHILKDKENSLDFSFINSSISSDNDYISNETSHRVEPLNVMKFFDRKELTINTVESEIQEEISVYSNNSLSTNNIEEQFVMNGKINVKISHFSINVIVSFAVSNSLVMNLIDNYYNETAQIYIDDKNIKDIHDPNNTTLKTALALVTSFFLRGRLKEIPLILNFGKRNSGSFIPQKEYFFSITNTINYAPRRFSTYYIKLYGLQNFKMLHTKYSKTVTEFKIMMTNLKARIIWNYYNGDYIRRVPKIRNLLIREFTLCAKISFTKRLLFTDQSRLLFLDRGNSTMVKLLKEKLEFIIINEIQQKIQQGYDKMNSN